MFSIKISIKLLSKILQQNVKRNWIFIAGNKNYKLELNTEKEVFMSYCI